MKRTTDVEIRSLPKAFYRSGDIAEILGVSRSYAHDLVTSGQVKFARLDGCVLIPTEEVERLIVELREKTGKWPNP